MNYRFEISLPNSTEFRCEIAIGGEQTFLQFHEKIIDVLGYDGSQMASFFTLDKLGNRVREISLMEMSEDDDETGALVMDVTQIHEVINAHCIELEYVYDLFTNRYFRVEYAGEYIADSADVLPVSLYCDGIIPEQTGLDSNEQWDFDKPEDEYDDSFMEEFSHDGDGDGEDYKLDDEDGYGEDDDFDGEGGKYGDKYESIDDYIDKM